MKLAALLAASILTLSGVALADDSGTTQVGHMNAKETISVPVSLPSGINVIEVWDENGQDISCAFVHGGDPQVKTGPTRRCYYHTDAHVLPAEGHMRVVNDNDKPVVYHLWIH